MTANAAAIEITARAAAIASHEEWVAFMTADENITAFAHNHLSVADFDLTDWYDALFVAGQVQYLLRLEVMTDAELITVYVDAQKAHQAFRDADGADYDVNDHESYHAQQGDIQALLAFRRVQARYTHALGLTHNPFAALLAA